jgi:hypothetical protein
LGALFLSVSAERKDKEVSMGEEMFPKFDYYLDESDPDVVILRRQDGAFVAAFSARGVTKEGIVEAAKEDYRKLLFGLRAREGQELSLDELPEHSAIVDNSGAIVAVNKAWKRFAMEYPCHSPTERRWFVGRVGRFTDGDSPMALVAHEKVIRRKKSVLAH